MFKVQDEQYVQRVSSSFAKQGAMSTLGAQLERVEPGEVEVRLPMSAALSQQHGFLHAGMMTAVLDSACGYAASTLMPAEAGVLTIEFKVNLLAPGQGESFRLIGRVAKAGRTITFVEGEAIALPSNKRIATMSATCMTITGRDGIQG